MRKRATNTHCGTLVLFFAIIHLLDCSRENRPSTARLEPFSELQIDGEIISLEKQRELRDELEKLPAVECEIYEKPDLEIHEIMGNTSETRIWSVFLGPGLIYQGLYLDAWTTRMKGKKSTCLSISTRMRDSITSR